MKALIWTCHLCCSVLVKRLFLQDCHTRSKAVLNMKGISVYTKLSPVINHEYLTHFMPIKYEIYANS